MSGIWTTHHGVREKGLITTDWGGGLLPQFLLGPTLHLKSNHGMSILGCTLRPLLCIANGETGFVNTE